MVGQPEPMVLIPPLPAIERGIDGPAAAGPGSRKERADAWWRRTWPRRLGQADALGTNAAALLGAGSADQDLATATPVPAGPWFADARTGRRGERPGPSLG